MKKVILLRGLPASGKTFWAKEFIKKNPTYKIINKDQLRNMLDDGKWSGHNEKFILMARDNLMSLAVLNGWNVIIDDTNLHPKHEQNIRNEVDLLNEIHSHHGKENKDKMIKVEIKDFIDVPLDECIKRDQKRANYVGEKVIRQMYRQFLQPKAPEIVYNKDLPSVVICDLDGTLALFGDNNPYDRNFLEDKVNSSVYSILDKFSKDGIKIILVSGRNNKYRLQTEEWLRENGISYDELHMLRNDGDNRKDIIIKQETYDQHIKDKYNVIFILDDRGQVVQYWRSIGLTCLQVAFGEF